MRTTAGAQEVRHGRQKVQFGISQALTFAKNWCVCLHRDSSKERQHFIWTVLARHRQQEGQIMMTDFIGVIGILRRPVFGFGAGIIRRARPAAASWYRVLTTHPGPMTATGDALCALL